GVVVAAAVGLTLYALAVTPPGAAPLARLLTGGEPSPFADYGVRFAAALVLLGLGPATVLRLGGGRLHEIGVGRAKRIRPAVVLLACGAAAVVGYLSRRNPQLAAFYPFGRPDSLELARSPLGVAAHAAAYLCCYYLPWELTFRGALLFPLVPRRAAGAPAVLLAATPQALASTLLHIGHPPVELAAAFPFGLALGLLAIRTGSIVPGLLIHAAAGIALDVAIMTGP
ncbi:MAG: CPBP family intramembrane metalloprotease, partial [Spirochaetaceae bacterium]|nr:CPBP family intramembrane metalloprotease [Spirochaetaceae bacterium]